MARTIAPLWNGDLIPGQYEEKEIQRAKELTERNRRALRQKLSAAQMEHLGRYEESFAEYHSLFAQAAFCEGFSLGLRMATEAMEE